VNASIDQAAISLGVATLLGACIGFERQWRQRMAGLRTNTLVAIGAASSEEAHIRALLLQGTGNGQLSLRRLESNDLEESGASKSLRSSRPNRGAMPFLNRSPAA
jgi:hypothetical protein